MKFSRVKSVLGACLLVACCSQTVIVRAQPYDESKYPMPDEVVKRQIEPPTASASIDEHLLKLAKAGNVNFIADATSLKNDEPVEAFPASPMAQFNKWQPKFHLAVLDFTQEKRLSLLRFNDNTFLFWPEPEQDHVLSLARRVAGNFPNSNEDENDTWMKLSRFLVNEKLLPQGEALKVGDTFEIALKDLTQAQQTYMRQVMKKFIADRNRSQLAWFDDTFWQGASIRLQPWPEKDKMAQGLTVIGSYNKEVVGTGLYGMGR